MLRKSVPEDHHLQTMKVVAIYRSEYSDSPDLPILLSHIILCLSQKPDNRSSSEEDDEYMLERLNNTDWYVQVLESTCSLSPNYIII